MSIKKQVKILLNTLYQTNNLINIYNKNFEYEKTISICFFGLKNYCPIFYGRSRNWVETEDMFKNFQVDFILKSYKKCDNT